MSETVLRDRMSLLREAIARARWGDGGDEHELALARMLAHLWSAPEQLERRLVDSKARAVQP